MTRLLLSQQPLSAHHLRPLEALAAGARHSGDDALALLRAFQLAVAAAGHACAQAPWLPERLRGLLLDAEEVAAQLSSAGWLRRLLAPPAEGDAGAGAGPAEALVRLRRKVSKALRAAAGEAPTPGAAAAAAAAAGAPPPAACAAAPPLPGARRANYGAMAAAVAGEAFTAAAAAVDAVVFPLSARQQLEARSRGGGLARLRQLFAAGDGDGLLAELSRPGTPALLLLTSDGLLGAPLSRAVRSRGSEGLRAAIDAEIGAAACRMAALAAVPDVRAGGAACVLLEQRELRQLWHGRWGSSEVVRASHFWAALLEHFAGRGLAEAVALVEDPLRRDVIELQIRGRKDARRRHLSLSELAAAFPPGRGLLPQLRWLATPPGAAAAALQPCQLNSLIGRLWGYPIQARGTPKEKGGGWGPKVGRAPPPQARGPPLTPSSAPLANHPQKTCRR